jgi:dTDP-4-dehydrorhamnose 3,5-epimerase
MGRRETKSLSLADDGRTAAPRIVNRMTDARATTAPYITDGGLAVDDRGTVIFANDFSFANVKRFYFVSNHRAGFIRAWHAHRREAQFIMAVQGTCVVGAVKIDDWENPSKDLPVNRFVLSEYKPSIVHIPAGYASGFMSLTAGAKVMVFSNVTLEESRADHVRFDAHYWDAWQVAER